MMRNLCFIALVGVSLLLSSASEGASDYNVVKQDRFSFRYPNDWEEGLAQAETTKVLVRAIKSRTGYAASCTVNISFVEGLDQYSQDKINAGNHRIHDLKYLSRIKEMLPDVQVLAYNTNTFLSFQPASSVEFTATARSHNVSQLNQFFQIMTIRKPNRYVVTCRGELESYAKAKGAIDLIISTFLID